jgi:spore coat protein CotH
MTRPDSLVWLMLMGSLAGACEEGSLQLGAADAGSATDAADSEGKTTAALGEPDNGRIVFDPLRVATLEIEVGETDREILRSEANKQINSDDFTYVVVSLRFDGELLEPVGMRVKGNSSRRASADNPDAIPYKLDLNKYVDGQKLDGLTKINLHRNASLNEYLSYGAFREAGIASSRTGWADVTLNGTSLGLYTLVEQVDERMLDHFYEDPTGELYKPEPPAGYLNDLGDDISAYGDVGYKADKDTDHATLLELIRTINEEPVSSWSEVLDVDSVLDYFAGNVALGNWDTYVAMGHNYYLFEDSPGHMQMLPWDLNLSQAASGVVCPADMARGGGPGGGAPGGGGPRGDASMPGGGFMPPEGFVPPDGGVPEGFMPPDDAVMRGAPGGGFGGNNSTPLYTRLMASEEGYALYAAALDQFLAGPGSEDSLNAAIDAVVPVLGERLSASDVASLRADIATRVAAIATGLTTTTTCVKE